MAHIEHDLDDTDKAIISMLSVDARRPFTEIAQKLKVSHGTIHQRYQKLCDSGIIEGSTLVLNQKKLGFDVAAFIGLNLAAARDYPKVKEKLSEFPEIKESHYTTGDFNIFTKVLVRNVDDLYRFLLKVQQLKEVSSTGTSIILNFNEDGSLPTTPSL